MLLFFKYSEKETKLNSLRSLQRFLKIATRARTALAHSLTAFALEKLNKNFNFAFPC